MAADAKQFDVGAQRLGLLYAKALLGAAEAVGQTETVLAELDALVTDLLDAHPKFEKVLGSVMISPAEKIAMLDRTLKSQVSPLLLKFLKVLAAHERLGFLRPIRSQAHEIYNEMRGRVRVEVTTAVAMAADMSGRLTEQVRAMLGREPQLVQRTDPALIGGVVLRVGDKVYDGSVATHLQRLRGQLRERSMQEIQSQRAKFFSSGV